MTTAAVVHDHRFCPVVEAIAQRAREDLEPWGTVHRMPPVELAEATEARRGIFRARKHGYSVKVDLGDPDPAGLYRLTVQVWTRAAAKQYIAGKVAAGEPLAYNVLRRNET